MAGAAGAMSVPFSAMKTGKWLNVIFIHCVERLSILLSVGRCRQSGMLLYFLRGYFFYALLVIVMCLVHSAMEKAIFLRIKMTPFSFFFAFLKKTRVVTD